MQPVPRPDRAKPPAPMPLLEEVSLAHVRDGAAALGFALGRLVPEDRRPVLLVASRRWLLEHGRPSARGIGRAADGLLLVAPRCDEDALWAMEQALRSGAVAGAIGMIDRASLTQTRRLDFAAREGGCVAVLVRRTGDGLSAARRRWRIATAASAEHRFDPRAPGRGRAAAELWRRRDGAPGAWLMEQDDATDRLGLADRLAGDGLVAHARPRLAG